MTRLGGEDPDSDIRASEAQFGWAPGSLPAPDAIAYVNRGAGVVVKLSTWPTPLDDHERVATLAAFETIADHLPA